MKTFQPLLVTASVPVVYLASNYMDYGILRRITAYYDEVVPTIDDDEPKYSNTEIKDVQNRENEIKINYAEDSAHDAPVTPPSAPDAVADSNWLEQFDALLYILIFLVAVVLLNIGGDDAEKQNFDSDEKHVEAAAQEIHSENAEGEGSQPESESKADASRNESQQNNSVHK